MLWNWLTTKCGFLQMLKEFERLMSADIGIKFMTGLEKYAETILAMEPKSTKKGDNQSASVIASMLEKAPEGDKKGKLFIEDLRAIVHIKCACSIFKRKGKDQLIITMPIVLL